MTGCMMSNKKKLADYHRFIFFFISVIFLLNPIPHISQAQQLTASERDWLAHKGEIVFVSQSNYPPFEFIDKDRSRAGMCIELIRWISTEFGFQARFLDMNFDQKGKMTENEKILFNSKYNIEKTAENYLKLYKEQLSE